MRRNRFRIIVGLIVLLALASAPSATSARRHGHASGSCANPPYKARFVLNANSFVGDRVHIWARVRNSRLNPKTHLSSSTVRWRPRPGKWGRNVRICEFRWSFPHHRTYVNHNPRGSSYTYHLGAEEAPGVEPLMLVTAAPR
jgi:hypothetical protein